MNLYKFSLSAAIVFSSWIGTVSEAPAQVTKTPKGYLIKSKYVKGKITKQKMVVNSKVSTGESNTRTIIYTSKVLEVKKNGNAIVEVTPKGISPNLDKPSRIEMDSFNRPIGGGIPGFAGGFGWPTEPVKIGQKWSGDYDAQGVPLKATYHFIGIKNNIGQINLSLGASGPLNMTGTGKMFFRMDGQLDSSQIAITMVIPNEGKKQTVKMNISIQTVK